MDLRNVQKSGNAYYLYLPSNWCKQHSINNDSQVTLDVSSEGKLIVSPYGSAEKNKSLTINLAEEDLRIINKLIVACYLNPVRSFRIRLEKEISAIEILDHKKLIGGMELVEFGEKQISCESTILVEDPDILLRTMIKKIINMLRIMTPERNPELVARYEEEIDRSNILINKSAISSFMFKKHSKLRHIDLFYIVNLSSHLERMADSAIKIENKKLLASLSELIKHMDKVLENVTVASVVPFAKQVLSINGKDEPSSRLANHLNVIADTLMDWAVSNESTK